MACLLIIRRVKNKDCRASHVHTQLTPSIVHLDSLVTKLTKYFSDKLYFPLELSLNPANSANLRVCSPRSIAGFLPPPSITHRRVSCCMEMFVPFAFCSNTSLIHPNMIYIKSNLTYLLTVVFSKPLFFLYYQINMKQSIVYRVVC